MNELEHDIGKITQPRLWRDNGWTARVIKNEDDDGWAVAMTPDGQSEPALVGPWTMGRDKKNPKPLDSPAFNTLVKTAAEFVRRHEQPARHRQQPHAQRGQSRELDRPAPHLFDFVALFLCDSLGHPTGNRGAGMNLATADHLHDIITGPAVG